MKIQLSNNPNNKEKNDVRFKGAANVVTCGLNFLNTNPTIGALCVDAMSMGIPRTTIDSFRGKDAATETAIREFGSTTNFALMGAWALGASALMGTFFNNKYKNAQAQKIFANSETIEAMSMLYNQGAGINKDKTVELYVNSFTDDIETLSNSEWKKIKGSEIQQQINKELVSLIKDAKSKKEEKAVKQKILNLLIAQTGANQNARLKVKNRTIEQPLENFVDSCVALGRSFRNVTDGKIDDNFIKSLKSNKLAASLLGVCIPISVAVSMQPLNSWLTKRRTGKAGFVGVEGGQIDNSGSLKAKKFITASLFGAGAFATIGKNLLNKVQFTSLIPNIPQFKMIYGLTIISRIIAARDKNELRETCIKDSLGFANWLILGGFVSKLTANAIDKNLINYDGSSVKNANKFKQSWHWLTNASIKSTKEILLNDMKKAGLSITDKDGNAKAFKQLLNELPKKMGSTRKKIKAINLAQLAGYAYSMLALGCGVTMFNIFVTKHLTKNKNIPEKKESIQEATNDITRVNPYFMSQKTLEKLNHEKVK